MYDILKNPKKQVIIICVLIAGYWGYHLGIDQSDVPVQVTVQSQSDVPVDTLQFDSREEFEEFEQQAESLPPVKSNDRSPSSTDDVISEYEYRIQFWDMIFGHLASILGSLAALLAPLITVWLNKKGYLSSDVAEELQENIST